MREAPVPGVQGDDTDTLYGRYLTFDIGDACYGIEIQFVTEIIGIQPITPLPGLPEFLKGIINLRGEIIPVMDVRLRFGKEPLTYNDRTCIIVVRLEEVDIGLIVDNVAEVLSIADADIVPPPEINKSGSRFIQGIGKVGNEVKLILNCRRLVGQEDIEAVLAETAALNKAEG